MPAKKMSIAQLRRLLAAHENKLDKLQKQRTTLARRLSTVDAKIAELGGEVPAAKPKRKKRKAAKKAAKKKVAKKKATKKKTASKPATGKTLLAYLKAAIAKSKKGMRVTDAAKAVVKAGYKTKAKDFYGIVAATMRDKKNFKKIKRGVYKVA